MQKNETEMNPKRLKQTHVFDAPPPTHIAGVVATVYSWTFDVWPKFQRFYEANKHLRIPTTDPELGSVVSHIRSQKIFLWHADFAMWLWCACFKMHTKDLQLNRERWTQVFASEGGVI